MSNFSERIEQDLKVLRTQRDELRVKLNLVSKELRDRWEELEKHWYKLEGKARAVGNESRESAHEITQAARLLADKIREGYRHIRDAL